MDKTPLFFLRFALSSLLLALAAPFTWAAPALPADAPFASGSDDFASAPTAIATGRHALTTDLTDFTSEPGENVMGYGRTAWWKFIPTETGYCTIDTLRTAQEEAPLKDTLIQVFTGGPTLSSLVLHTYNNNFSTHAIAGPSYTLSSVTFHAQQGTPYYLSVDTFQQPTPAHRNVALQLRLLPLRASTRTLTWSLSPALQDHGLLTLTTTAAGRYSGRLTAGTQVWPFVGTFTTDGRATRAFQRRRSPAGSPPPLPLTLTLDATLGGHYHIAQDSYRQTSGRLPQQTRFTPDTPCTLTGYYTCHMPLTSGTGLLTATIRPTGTLTGTATTPDGTVLTFGSALHQPTPTTSHTFPVYRNHTSGKGLFTFEGSVIERGTLDVMATNKSGIRIRPASPTYYPQGISEGVHIRGSTYLRPQPGHRALAFLDATLGRGQLTLSPTPGGLLAPLIEDLTLSDSNKITFDNALHKPTPTLNAATGLLTGTLIAEGKKRRIKGILALTDEGPALHGFATGTTRTIPLALTPLPPAAD